MADNLELCVQNNNVLSRWLKAVARSDDTRISYLRTLLFWKRTLGDFDKVMNVSQERVLEICDWWRKDLAERTIRHRWMVLRSFVGWCASVGLRPEPPRWKRYAIRSMRVDEKRVVRGGKAGLRTALTLKEARKVLKWARRQDPEKEVVILLEMVAGLRGIEVYRAKWDDVDLSKGTMSVEGKGGQIRKVRLEPIVVRALERLDLKAGDLVSVCRRSILRWGKEAWEVAGREGEGSGHGLRRTAATLLREHGADLEQVQEFLGHSDVKTTLRCYVARKSKLTATTRIGGRK